MDVISLGKASKVLKEINQLDKEVVAPLAESRFPTVDARLDWLEGQAEKIKADNSLQVDLIQGTFTDTEYIDGKVQLKKANDTSYLSFGTYESPVIDLGEGWFQTQLIDIQKTIAVDRTEAIVQVSFSTDGLTYSAYSSFNPDELPQGRYLKFFVELSSVPEAAEENTYAYSQSEENKILLNDYTQADGQLTLKTDYQYDSEDSMVNEGYKIMRTPIPKSLFRQMKSLEVR